MNQQNEWELLDPQLKNHISILNKNIINLTEQNKKLHNTVNELKIQIKNINKFHFELSYAIDNGQLLKLSKSILISINYKFSFNSVSK